MQAHQTLKQLVASVLQLEVCTSNISSHRLRDVVGLVPRHRIVAELFAEQRRIVEEPTDLRRIAEEQRLGVARIIVAVVTVVLKIKTMTRWY